MDKEQLTLDLGGYLLMYAFITEIFSSHPWNKFPGCRTKDQNIITTIKVYKERYQEQQTLNEQQEPISPAEIKWIKLN